MNKLIKKLPCLLVLFLATALVACSQQESPDNTRASLGRPLTLRFSDSGFSDSQTRSVEKGDTTRFVSGDAIGILAIKNGKVISDVNNIKATYNGSVWESDYIYAYAGATYIAYTPYNDNLDTSAITTEANLIERHAIEDNQSYRQAYVNSDLMTGVGTVSDDNVITFTMSHAYSMIEVVLPRKTYKFDRSALSDYHVPTSTFINQGDELTMYASTPNAWRRIIQPGDAFTLSGSYTDANGKIMDYSYTLEEGVIKAGECRRLVIGKEEVIEFTTNQGDIMFRDGTLMSRKDLKDGGKNVLTDAQKANVLGIVIYATNKSVKFGSAETEYLNGKSITPHGYVLALKDATTEDDTKDFTWLNGKESTLTTAGHPYLTTLDEVRNDFEGLARTQSMKSVGGDSEMIQAITRFNETSSRPEALTTEWFLPSSGQWISILDRLCGAGFTAFQTVDEPEHHYFFYESTKSDIMNDLNNKLLNVDTKGSSYIDLFAYHNEGSVAYWTSSEGNGDESYDIWFDKNDDNGEKLIIVRDGKDRSIFARCILAF